MIEIICGDCGAAIMDRSKSSYNEKLDRFYCNQKCENTHKQQLEVDVKPIGEKGQLSWDWSM